VITIIQKKFDISENPLCEIVQKVRKCKRIEAKELGLSTIRSVALGNRPLGNRGEMGIGNMSLEAGKSITFWIIPRRTMEFNSINKTPLEVEVTLSFFFPDKISSFVSDNNKAH
jgi:hypothetical protein